MFLYALVDPRTGRDFYVGITSAPEQRFYNHLHAGENGSLVAAYIERLRAAGLEPTMQVLAEGAERWEERAAITSYNAECNVMTRVRVVREAGYTPGRKPPRFDNYRRHGRRVKEAA